MSNSKKQKLVAAKHGLMLDSKLSSHLRKVIEDGEKSLQEGKAKKCSMSEMIRLVKSL